MVKLTRTLSIVPIVLMFSLINARQEAKLQNREVKREKVAIKEIFPYFILMFLAMVAIKSTGLVPDFVSSNIAVISKFMMVMALAAIGLRTNFEEVSKSGIKPMIHGFIISALVVIVSYVVQVALGQV